MSTRRLRPGLTVWKRGVLHHLMDAIVVEASSLVARMLSLVLVGWPGEGDQRSWSAGWFQKSQRT